MASADKRVTDGIVEETVQTLLSADRRQVDLSELAYELVEAFGGTRALARRVFTHYHQSPDGGMVKGQILKYVLGLLEKHAALTKDQPTGEDHMSEAELLEDATLLFEEIQRTKAGAAPAAADSEAAEEAEEGGAA